MIDCCVSERRGWAKKLPHDLVLPHLLLLVPNHDGLYDVPLLWGEVGEVRTLCHSVQGGRLGQQHARLSSRRPAGRTAPSDFTHSVLPAVWRHSSSLAIDPPSKHRTPTPPGYCPLLLRGFPLPSPGQNPAGSHPSVGQASLELFHTSSWGLLASRLPLWYSPSAPSHSPSRALQIIELMDKI